MEHVLVKSEELNNILRTAEIIVYFLPGKTTLSVRVLKAVVSQPTGLFGWAGETTLTPVTWSVEFCPAKNWENKTPKLAVLAAEVRLTMNPAKAISVVASGAKLRSRPSIGPTK